MQCKQHLLILLTFCWFSFSIYATGDTSQEEGWDGFIERMYQRADEKNLQPFSVVTVLVRDYLWQIESEHPVLDLGCELGKNAICLIEAGHRVVLLDVSPKAIFYTQENLKKLNLDHGIAGTCVTPLENLDPLFGPFKAIVGTYVFSFIHPEQFQEVMTKNVFEKIEVGGFFAGGFFGPDHSWANKPILTIMTREELEELFASQGFSICHIGEVKKKVKTGDGNEPQFHVFKIVAQRLY